MTSTLGICQPRPVDLCCPHGRRSPGRSTRTSRSHGRGLVPGSWPWSKPMGPGTAPSPSAGRDHRRSSMARDDRDCRGPVYCPTSPPAHGHRHGPRGLPGACVGHADRWRMAGAAQGQVRVVDRMARSNTLANDGNWDRRSVLRAAAVMAGTAATAPLLGESALAQAGLSSDANALFKAGEFEPDHHRLRGSVADPAPPDPRNGQQGTR